MSKPITVDIREMQTVFLKANAYLSNLSNLSKTKATDTEGIQARLDEAAALWEKHLNIKVNSIWGTGTLTFTFKDKAAFTLFMLEWS
jgi:hypothetical protein